MRFIKLSLLFVLFHSCQMGPKDKEIIRTVRVPAEIQEEDEFQYDTLEGIYKGDFAGSEIRIVLNYVSGSHAIGYDIHKGLQRNLNGNVRRSGDTIYMILEEPGDNEYDGTFSLVFIGMDQHPKGSWEPINKQIDAKNFKLEKVDLKRVNDQNTAESFILYTGMLYDTLGHYSFQEDGLCIFSYYPSDIKEGGSEQKVEFTGNWTATSDSVIRIDWQPNKFFKRTEEFKLSRLYFDDDDEYFQSYLKGNDRELHGMFY